MIPRPSLNLDDTRLTMFHTAVGPAQDERSADEFWYGAQTSPAVARRVRGDAHVCAQSLTP